jgi:hypothetical protein
MERSRKRRKVEIIPEKDKDNFTKSHCNCDFCTETHEAVVNWGNQFFETKLQKNMKKIIQRIEEKYC